VRIFPKQVTIIKLTASSIGTVQDKDKKIRTYFTHLRTSGQTTQNQYCPDIITTVGNSVLPTGEPLTKKDKVASQLKTADTAPPDTRKFAVLNKRVFREYITCART
jgi:hypothetical protein